ncbi:MFS transporter [Rhodoferax aquaticus]|uniref:MFS transporter n=1 Tax=Rhodoferax aquaticus TaxID=2527691 RepID=A0A515ETZ1_9BURK|nr:MFS transporter [Rhodoferax aquaticus]QDL56043.1 MFS transporter [Rhodoferax aquaticus]
MRAHHLSFYSSLLLSRLADQVLLFLVPLVVYQQTGSASWTGIAFFIETLTRFVAFPVCGVLSDRHPPLRLLRQSQALRALSCVAGLAAGYALSGQAALGALVLASAACGVFTTQGVMAREVLLPHIFPGERFERVLAHAQIADQLGMVAGPVVAAAALAIWPWQGVLGCSALMFVLADAALAWWQRQHTGALPQGRSAVGESWWVPLRTALAHIARLPGLKPLIALAAGVNLVVGVTQATAAAMLTGLLGQSAAAYAQLQTAGAVLTVLVLAWVARAHWRGHALGVWSYALLLVGGLMTAWAAHPAVYALGFLLVIGFDKMFSIYIRAARQRIIPAQDFGKTSGVVVLLNNLTQPLAGLAVGLGAQGADARGVIAVLVVGMGVIGVAVLVLAATEQHT